MVHYEWDIETHSFNAGELEVEDHHFYDTLRDYQPAELARALDPNEPREVLVLVRTTDSGEKSWAYYDYQLKSLGAFQDAYQQPVCSAPAKYQKELERFRDA